MQARARPYWCLQNDMPLWVDEVIVSLKRIKPVYKVISGSPQLWVRGLGGHVASRFDAARR